MASITKLPSGAYRVQIRRKGRYASETFLLRDDAHRWARQAETRVDQGLAPNKSSVSRLATFGDLNDLHIVDMCEVGKPPRRSKAATLAALKRDLGKEGSVHERGGLLRRAGGVTGVAIEDVGYGGVWTLQPRTDGDPPLGTLLRNALPGSG